MQGITVLNLDKLIEDVVGVGGGVCKDMSYEELDEFLRSNPYVAYPKHDHYFTLFKLIHEEPNKAKELLGRAAKHFFGTSSKESWEGETYGKAIEGKSSFLRIAKRSLLLSFTNHDSTAPSIYSWTSYYIWTLVKDNPNTALDFFRKCYEKLAKNNKISEGWEENQLKIQLIIECLKTRDFSTNIQPKHLELKVVPKKDYITILDEVDINNCAKLTKYLVDSEKASFKNLGIIEGKAILIPREGKEDWSKGLYIVTYDSTRLTDKIYKTEKFHTDEELVKKTVGKGEITRPDLEKITRTIIDLA